MGLFNLFRVCSALFLAAAIIPAHANYIYDNRTGTWTPTARTVLAPVGSASPFNYIPRDSPPTVTSTGAFQNKTGGTFGSPPINGTSRTVPVTLNGTTTPANVKKSLLSRLGKGGLAGLTLGLGIDALLNSIGALIDEGGNVSRRGDPSATLTDGNYWFADPVSYQGVLCHNPNLHLALECSAAAVTAVWPNAAPSSGIECRVESQNTICSQQYTIPPDIDIRKISATAPFIVDLDYELSPVPLPELEDAINSDYQPHPSDYPTISAEPDMMPTIVEVEPIPTTTIPPITTTTVDVDTGKTTTVTTNIWQDYSLKDNNSPQPKIDADTTTKSDTYEDGVKTGESTTTTSSGTASGTDPASGSGSSQQLEIDIPTDCDFMPTVCAFLEWFKDDDLDEEPDLASIMKDDEEFAKTKVISFGAAVCPQPYTIHISSLSMSVDLSFEFFCQFAEYARALVLAAAYIFAAYISLGVARG